MVVLLCYVVNWIISYTVSQIISVCMSFGSQSIVCLEPYICVLELSFVEFELEAFTFLFLEKFLEYLVLKFYK